MTNIKSAIDKMISEEIAVVVLDLSKYNANWATLIKILKQSHPMSLSVVITDSADAKVAISLINQGQVYRYLPKPIHTGRLKLSVWSALRYYQQCKAKPIQLERHQVEDLSVEDELVLNSTFINRLAQFKNRIFSNFPNRKV
jgi:serine/threonine-protein kinase